MMLEMVMKKVVKIKLMLWHNNCVAELSKAIYVTIFRKNHIKNRMENNFATMGEMLEMPVGKCPLLHGDSMPFLSLR